MAQSTSIKLFQDKNIRTIWDEELEKWYFSVIDVIAVLTDSDNPRKYWSVLKTRLKAEGSQLATNCSQLKMPGADGKMRETDAADTAQILRLVQVEAIEAFIRSIHWYNNSNSQARIYLKFLYKWIAIETIAKTSFDEDIIPKLCLVLGFPLSKHLKSIQRQDIEKWTSIMGYKNYKNIIKKELYKCKKIRNDIVHSGFKETNLINENLELKLYIINSAYSCMTNTIEKIIMSGRNTIQDVWDVMCEYVMQDKNLMHWISGTFLNQVNVFVADSGATHDDDLFQ
jgi:hypothetical protein